MSLHEMRAHIKVESSGRQLLVIRHSGLTCVMVGQYSEWDAERLLPAAKGILGQGGYVRDMRRWCTYLDEQYDGVRRCYR